MFSRSLAAGEVWSCFALQSPWQHSLVIAALTGLQQGHPVPHVGLTGNSEVLVAQQ